MKKEFKDLEIIVSERETIMAGFNFKPGMIAVFDGELLVAATSGWAVNDQIMVYRPTENWNWQGNWEGRETFPIEEVLDAIQDFEEMEEIKKAIAYADGKKLKTSDKKLVFTDTVPGEKSRDGGEYGFYTVYSPIPEYPGIYRVSTETTCDFDACGTGSQGIRVLTVQKYRRLKKVSDKVEIAGSLY